MARVPLHLATPTRAVGLQRERWPVIYGVPWETLSITSVVRSVYRSGCTLGPSYLHIASSPPVMAFKGKSRADACVFCLK